MSRGGNAWEGNQALRHLHPNLLHTSPAPRPPGAEGEAAGGAFPGPKPEEAPLGQGRGVVGPPPVIHLAVPEPSRPRWTRPPGPPPVCGQGEDQAGAALRPEEQPRPGYGAHPVQLHRSRLPGPVAKNKFAIGPYLYSFSYRRQNFAPNCGKLFTFRACLRRLHRFGGA